MPMHPLTSPHRLWGNASHFDYMAAALRARFPADRLRILVATSNTGAFTYDGVERGAERVMREVESALREMMAGGEEEGVLSIVGYSLGGLVARYVVGLLEWKGWFEKVQPVNFTTFATPHLGVRTPLPGLHNHLWNVVGARTLSASGRQLFLTDRFRHTDRPLLSLLADPASVFVRGLARFARRAAYANIVNDTASVYYTTCIAGADPFADLAKVRLNYLRGYAPVLLDPAAPVAVPSPHDPRPAPAAPPVAAAAARRLALALALPLAALLFLLAAALQSARSALRIRRHDRGAAAWEWAGVPLAAAAAVDGVDGAFGGTGADDGGSESGSGADELDGEALLGGRGGEALLGGRGGEGAAAASLSASSSPPSSTSPQAPSPSASGLAFPPLALSPAQRAMLRTLDALGWARFPVHIQRSAHSHAAIIVRARGRKGFEEGEVVVGHWVEGFVD
ncbi:putative serine esterase-domain-containing protein [Lineolata rhizophorae]|uniref:Putative serine esterase-domain-containing protein n=1 Tax=Lineolata rhizophorae TaxID=578093 RepID=A0A6A6NNE8_9PEZI|nr:putative serine esterase-domain-containing protein [Lineolata rhizophorae]